MASLPKPNERNTLEQRDLSITGTPGGVGAFRNPPRRLQHNDEITIEIGTLRSITNPVASAPQGE